MQQHAYFLLLVTFAFSTRGATTYFAGEATLIGSIIFYATSIVMSPWSTSFVAL